LKTKIPRSVPEIEGISSRSILKFLETTKKLGLHSFMLLRHGKVVSEGWWKPYASGTVHLLNSLSKSFTSIATGLAIYEGRLSIEDRVFSFFPDKVPENPSAHLQEMTIRHLLTMTTGHEIDTTGKVVISKDWVKEFLNLPVEHRPGTKFTYNSCATYMLSAILQKVTGETLVQYLKTRLFDPMGFGKLTWDSCPAGINTGGWGLSLTTEDIAKFGLLCLWKGTWHGKKLVPESWIEKATSKQVETGDPAADPANDWAQGYGYQFWRCTHGFYRGDGAFGQYCVVMSDLDTVFICTAGIPNMGGILKSFWKTVLPGISSLKKEIDKKSLQLLRKKEKSLMLDSVTGLKSSPWQGKMMGREFIFKKNDRLFQTIMFRNKKKDLEIVFEKNGKVFLISCGYEDWGRKKFMPSGLFMSAGIPGMRTEKEVSVRCRYAWIRQDILVVTTCMFETPFIQKTSFHFKGDQLRMRRSLNVGFGSTKTACLTARLAGNMRHG